jgi:SAM-dependent methyltransferase
MGHLRISVCLCTYNGEPYLSQLLESLAAQRDLPDELIVSDDGSVDQTLELVAGFAETAPFPVRLVGNRTRLGVAANFAHVLSSASGDLLLPCDQDDVWYENKIAVLKAVFLSEPLIAGAFHDSDLVDEAGRPIGRTSWSAAGFTRQAREQVHTGASLAYLIRHPIVPGHCLAIARRALPAMLPFSDSANYDSWCSRLLAAQGRLEVLDVRLVAHRLHAANLVGVRAATTVRQRLLRAPDVDRTLVAELEGLRDLRLRLADVAPRKLSGPAGRELAGKVAHIEQRAKIGSRGHALGGRLASCRVVAAELVSGRYRRYSNGWKSSALDLWRALLGPGRTEGRSPSPEARTEPRRRAQPCCPVCGSRPGSHDKAWTVKDRTFRLDGLFELTTCGTCRSLYLADPPLDVSPYYPENYYSYGTDEESEPASPAGARRGARGAGRALKDALRAACQSSTGARSLLPRLWDVDGYLMSCFGERVGRVLDLGCGSGEGLDRYKAAGWSTWGVEVDADAAMRARAKGHSVECRGLLETDLGEERFDVVRMRHVVEHVAEPLAAVEAGMRSLAPGGRLFIEIPNLQGLLARLSGPAYWGLEPPRHLAIPHPAPLLGKLRDLGASKVATSAYSRGEGIARTLWMARGSRHASRRSDAWVLSDPVPPAMRVAQRLLDPLALACDAAGFGDLLRIVAMKPPIDAG